MPVTQQRVQSLPISGHAITKSAAAIGGEYYISLRVIVGNASSEPNPSWADYIITTSEFEFSVVTGTVEGDIPRVNPTKLGHHQD